MPTLETPPNPAPPTPPTTPIKVRTGRFGELEEHELIHLIDSLDDERARARFRESVYISVIFWIFVLLAGIFAPRWLPRGPRIAEAPIKEQHDTNLMANLAVPKDLAHELARHPAPPRPTPPTPQPTVNTPAPPPAPQAKQQPAPQQPAPQPQQQQQNPNRPQTPQPPPPPAPAPQQQAMVDAPRPSFTQPRTPSAGSAVQQAARDAARAQQGGGAYAPPTMGGHGRAPLGAGAEILTDTQGVDFSAWLARFKNDVQRNWDPLIPESVYPPISKRGIVGIRIMILKDGRIATAPILEGRSGDNALDKAAWSALTSEGVYPPLPKEFPGPNIEIRCTFLYNETPQ